MDCVAYWSLQTISCSDLSGQCKFLKVGWPSGAFQKIQKQGIIITTKAYNYDLFYTSSRISSSVVTVSSTKYQFHSIKLPCMFNFSVNSPTIYSCANLTTLNIDITSCQMAMSYILRSSCSPRLHSSVLGYVYDLRSSFIRWLKVRGTPRGASWIAFVQTNFEDEAKTLLLKKVSGQILCMTRAY